MSYQVAALDCGGGAACEVKAKSLRLPSPVLFPFPARSPSAKLLPLTVALAFSTCCRRNLQSTDKNNSAMDTTG